jgi:hypothetical protein
MSLSPTGLAGGIRMAPMGPRPEPGRRFVIAVTLLAGLSMVVPGVWALLWPGAFADAVAFPRHTRWPARASPQGTSHQRIPGVSRARAR